jgi:hypothetical protein
MAGKPLHDGIAGEFGVSLPFHGKAIAAQPQKVALQTRCLQTGVAGQKR